MDKDTTQAKLYEHYLSFFLPEGMLDFFELVWMETESLTSRESQKDIAYTGVLHIHLDERDSRTEAQQDLRSNGFTEPATMSDFPVRDRRVELHIRRRRWLTPDGRSVILNIYPLCRRRDPVLRSVCRVPEKKLGYDPGDSTLPW